MTASTLQGPFINLGEVEHVTVVQLLRLVEPGQTDLIEGATGQLIATRTGTPHLMGFAVDGGTRFGSLHVNMKRINVSAKRVSDGEMIELFNLECVNPGDPAIFLQNFP